MTDNQQQWNEFLEESQVYPDSLSSVELRLNNRIRREHRKKSVRYSALSLIAAVFSFVILVNTSTVFASTISNIPLIGKLVDYVRFDKSLSNAIKNEYVQEVGLTAWDGQNCFYLPYLIADERNLVLFFQLPEEFEQTSNDWVHINLKKMTNPMTGEEIEGFSCYTSGLSMEGRTENNGFLMQRYNFTEGTLPSSIEIEVDLEVESLGISQRKQKVGDADANSTKPVLEKVGTFTFQIAFEDFAKPIQYQLNKNYIIEGQKITVEKVTVYPTGTEVNFTFPNTNTAWINGLDLQLEQDNTTMLKGTSGISSTYSGDYSIRSVYIESNYFDTPHNQDLLIQGIRLLNKEEEYITVDLNKKTITPSISGMELTEVSYTNGSAALVFTTEVTDNDCFGLFYSDYKDAEGNTYNFQGEGSTVEDSLMKTYLTVANPDSGKIILKRALTPNLKLDEPLRINLPIVN